MQKLRWLSATLLLLAGCSTPSHTSKAPEPAVNANESGMIVTPTQDVAGRVSLANMQGRYVVLTFPIGTLPEAGRQMALYRNGLKVAEIRVSGPNRDNSTIADVLTGEAHVGDEVR